MKAFTCTEDRALRLLSREKPRVHPDTALMRVLGAAICGTDLRTYRHGSDRIRPPRVIGHEACGLIEEVGSSVKGLEPGRRVVVVPAVGCGECRWCRAGKTNMCDSLRTVGFDFDGTFAEYMEIPAQALAMGNVLPVSDSVATEQAVLAEPAACCLNGQEFLQIGPQDTVFIFGSGFIGCVHAELALRKGAKRVILSDVSDARLEVARALLPPLDTVNTASGDAVRFVRDRTDGLGADVIITACPSGDAHAAAMKMAATRARISLFGGIPGEGKWFSGQQRDPLPGAVGVRVPRLHGGAEPAGAGLAVRGEAGSGQVRLRDLRPVGHRGGIRGAAQRKGPQGPDPALRPQPRKETRRQMEKKGYILAIDQGTTGSRVILFNHDGMVHSMAYRELRQIYPQPGWVEHDPVEIWTSVRDCMAQALEEGRVEPKEILGIGITNQRESTILWERDTGRPLYNSICWQCRRSAAICDELKAAGREPAVTEKTGLVIDAYFSATKIKWLMDNVPEVRRQIERDNLCMGNIDSWLIWNLTGRAAHVTDFSNASRTMLLNIHKPGLGPGDHGLARDTGEDPADGPAFQRSHGAHLPRRLRREGADRRGRGGPARGHLRPGLLSPRHGQELLRNGAGGVHEHRHDPGALQARPHHGPGLAHRGQGGVRAGRGDLHRRGGHRVAEDRSGSHQRTPPRRAPWPRRCRTPAGSTWCPPSRASAPRTGTCTPGA